MRKMTIQELTRRISASSQIFLLLSNLPVTRSRSLCASELIIFELMSVMEERKSWIGFVGSTKREWGIFGWVLKVRMQEVCGIMGSGVCGERREEEVFRIQICHSSGPARRGNDEGETAISES